MSAIGILGGMGPQASNKLYELLISKTARYTPAALDEDYPEIVLLNVPVPNFISDKTKIRLATEILLEKTKILEQAGCTINGIACNTVHLLLPRLQQATTVPFVSLPSLVSQRIADANMRRVGLLATPTTLRSQLYDQAICNATVVRPDVATAALTEAVIYKRLANQLGASEQKAFKRAVDVFINSQKLDAVILGCTELPLAYGPSRDDKIIDTLEVLADGLLARYFNQQTARLLAADQRSRVRPMNVGEKGGL